MTTTFRRMAIGIVVMVVIGFVVLGIFFSGYAAWDAYADRGRAEVTAKLGALRASGVPMDNESLDAWYREHSDSADVRAWQAVFAQFQSPEFKSLTRGIEGFDPQASDTKRTADPWPAEEASRKLLAETTELRKEIHRLASKRVPVQFPIQYDSTVKTTLDHLKMMADVCCLLRVENDIAIRDRDSAEILASTQTLFDLRVIVSGDTSAVSFLTGLSCRRYALVYLKEALENDLIEAAKLEPFAMSLSREELEADLLLRVLQAERALAIPIFDNPIKYMDKLPSNLPKNQRPTAQDCMNYLEFMEQCEALLQLPMAESITECEAMSDRLRKRKEDAGILGKRDWILTPVLALHMKTVFAPFCRDRQQLNMVMHGIAIRRYQDQLGEFPRDLSALNDIGFDTFDYMPVGKHPMGYRRDGDEAILWSTHPQLGIVTTAEPPKLDPADRDYELLREMLWKFVP